MSPRPGSPSTGPPIRWWPALVILAIALGLLVWIWLRDAPSLQHRVVPTFPVLFFSTLALIVWLVAYSRLAKRTRLRIFLAIALVVGAGFLLLEIQGVSGNLVPVVGWRWAGEGSFDDAATWVGVTASGPDDYPQFYGPRRDATLPGPALGRDWRAQPPRELWRRAVGQGWSSFAVVGNAALTQELRGEDEAVVRYELATGRQVWVHADRAPFNTTIGGSGPRATPTVTGARVYTLGATGILNALELESGRRLWTRNILDDHGAGLPDWGTASSPLVVDGLVVVPLGELGNGLAAYDGDTGEPVWYTQVGGGSYSSPTLATIAGRRQVLVVNGRSVSGHDPGSGELLWRAAWPDPGERVTPPLRLDDDRLLVSAGYGIGSRLFRIRPAGESFAVDELWRSPRLKSKFAPMVLHQGVVYGLDDGVLVALDPETGQRLWKRGRYGHGQLILVGDLLLIQAESGEVVLVAADRDRHRELARLAALEGKTWNPPALSGRLLLVRNNREAACYELPLAG